MPFSSSHYAADAYVTGANPAPGRQLEFEYQIRSGTGYTTGTSTRYDGGIGINVYIAGGGGPSGTIPIVGGAQPASGSSHFEIVFSTSSVILLPANAGRNAFSIYNDANQTYLVRLGSIASVSAWSFSLFPQQFYESSYPGYTGDVAGIGFITGSGTIHVEEMI